MNKLKRFIKKVRRLLMIESLLDYQTKRLMYEQRKEFLIQQAFKSTEPGVTKEKYCDKEVIVSIATHGERFYEAYIAIESIMQQSVKPNRIILNVAKNEFEGKPIPSSLLHQQKRGLEINYCEDYWSFKKLIPTLKRFPEAIIVTFDDDCIYNVDVLENMLQAYKTDPKAIWGNRIHELSFDSQGNLKCYLDWKLTIPNTEVASKYFFITTEGGALYPPHSLYQDVTRDDIFMDISKTNDDVWCYVMALLQGTSIRKVRTHCSWGEDYYLVDDMQSSGLSVNNCARKGEECPNDVVIRDVFSKYNVYKILKN